MTDKEVSLGVVVRSSLILIHLVYEDSENRFVISIVVNLLLHSFLYNKSSISF